MARKRKNVLGVDRFDLYCESNPEEPYSDTLKIYYSGIELVYKKCLNHL